VLEYDEDDFTDDFEEDSLSNEDAGDEGSEDGRNKEDKEGEIDEVTPSPLRKVDRLLWKVSHR
jgi:hypothetical protein